MGKDVELGAVAAQRTDPIESFDSAQFLVNSPTGEHLPVARENDAPDAESLSHLLDLRGQRTAVGRVALKDLDRHEIALAVAQQPVEARSLSSPIRSIVRSTATT